MISSEFLITSLIVVLIPGTGVIYTVSTGLFLGWRASLAAAAGCTAGIIPHLIASTLGLSAILHTSAIAFQAVKMAGAAYLLYLAFLIWRETGSLSFGDSMPQKGLAGIALKGFLINILNPKLSIFFLAFLPLFVSPGAYSPTWQMFLLSLVFMGMTLFVFVIYGTSANALRSRAEKSPGFIMMIQRSFAIIFAGLGIKLAFSER